MIIRDDKEITCLGQFDGVVCYIKTADNKGVHGDIFKVVTAICFTDLERNIIYKRESIGSYICRLESTKDYFNLMDIIQDLALYVDKNKYIEYFKNQVIDNILDNNYSGLITLKNFKKEYYNNIADQIRKEKAEECSKVIDSIKGEIESTTKEINNYIEMRVFNPSKRNEYQLEFATKYTLKKFDTSGMYNNEEGIERYKNILKWLNDYLYYINNNYDPVKFLEFDKVIKVG